LYQETIEILSGLLSNNILLKCILSRISFPIKVCYTGTIRVEKAPLALILKPFDKVVNSKKKGYEVNGLKAVLVFNGISKI